MPYIISTSLQEQQNEHMAVKTPTGSKAVATLDEAREAAYATVENQIATSGPSYASPDDAQTMALAAAHIPAEGGTIGPLPDGTVIAVRPTDWLELAGLAGWTLDAAGRARVTGRTRKADRIALLAAFNNQ